MKWEDKPYTREELEEMPDSFPERGPVCPKCSTHIPQFADLPDSDAHRIRMMIMDGRKAAAMNELKAFTGCSERWAKIWVIHSGRPDAVGTTAPCPYCGKPLKTALAKQCPHCSMEWHDPDNIRNLTDVI